MWNNGSYDSDDPARPARTHVNTTSAVITQITRVRNLTNGTPARFSLQAGDLCYAQAQGDIQPIINPDGPNGTQPSSGHTPMPPANSGGWDYYDPWIWTSWFPMTEASAATIPWMAATGNHEPEMFSSQVAADHDLSWEIRGLLGCSHGAQVRWLEDQLRAWRQARGVDFIVAFFHECAFSTCNGHSSDAGARSSKQAVAISPAEPAEVEPAKDGNAKTQTGPYVNELDFSLTYETVDWSQARYDDYGFVALDVTPAAAGQKTTMVLRFINERGRELDRVVFSRIAGT